tara:strand:+ start:169 stop:849 length:681 start_codon:yes stop_codon:yes gene_type:complete
MEILDDPERLISIRGHGDFKGYRSAPVNKEPWTYEWLKDFDKNVVFYDVGACVGSYSLMAAARGALVYAFEPLPVNVAELHMNTFQNHLVEKIFITGIAAGLHDGFVDLHLHTAAIAGYGLASTDNDVDKEVHIKVPMVTLDGLSPRMYSSPTHVKIDVEGAELAVLQGMSGFLDGETLKSLIVELEDKESEERVSAFMQKHGWSGEKVSINRIGHPVRTLVYERD